MACPLAALLAVLFWPGLGPAQQTPEQELQFYTQPYTPAVAASLRRTAFLVEINAVVRNRKGHTVSGLRRKDFRVYDNGKRQTINLFETERAPAVMNTARPPSKPQRATAAKEPPSPSKMATAPMPRFIALFFDDRNISFGDLRYVQMAAEKFVGKDMRAGDHVGVFTASGAVTLNFTSDKRKLLKAIASIRYKIQGMPASRPSPCTYYALGPYASYLIVDRSDQEVAGLYSCRETGPGPAGMSCQEPFPPPTPVELWNEAQNVLYEADIASRLTLGSLQSVIVRVARERGRRLVVLISPGFFTTLSKRAVDSLATEALRGNVIIDSLDAKGLTAPEGGQSRNPGSACPIKPLEQILHHQKINVMNEVMADLAEDSGGTFFHNSNDLAAGLRQMAAVPEVSYLLGFSPSRIRDNGSYHRLKVKVTVPGSFKIRARRGYFAPGRATRLARERLEELDREALESNFVRRFPVEIDVLPGQLPSGKTGVGVTLRMNPKAVSFLKLGGRQHLGQLRMIVALFDKTGRFITGEQGLVNMELKKETLQGLVKSGINARIVLQAPQGSYRLRVVVEDMRSGRIFAETSTASIP